MNKNELSAGTAADKRTTADNSTSASLVQNGMLCVRAGDIVEFIAISWNESHWEFDYPTVVLSPVTRYSPNGEHPEMMIEDLTIECVCGGVKNHDYSDEFNWRGWKLSTLQKVARERLDGKDTWKTKIRSVIKQKIKFIRVQGELEFDVLETIEV